MSGNSACRDRAFEIAVRSAQVPEHGTLVQRDVIGFVALDFVLRLVRRGTVDVALVIDRPCVNLDNCPAHPPGFRIPADMVADLEFFRHPHLAAALYSLVSDLSASMLATVVQFLDNGRIGQRTIRRKLRSCGHLCPIDVILSKYVEHRLVRGDQVVGNDPPVTSPPNRFRAHDRAWCHMAKFA